VAPGMTEKYGHWANKPKTDSGVVVLVNGIVVLSDAVRCSY